MTPHEIVEMFVRLTARCLDALIAQYVGPERPTAWTGLFVRPRDGGDPVRSGTLDGLGTFQLHGRGCQFEMDTGEDLDVDWAPDGRAVFDSWRILMFARSIGDDSVDQETLRVAAADASSIVQIRPDTFAWISRRYDVTWALTTSRL